MASIFDILGPVMVGPSSSHTAGAVKIGLIARQLLGKRPERAEIYLSGSFAATGEGHGTDKALVAGLLGMRPDDMHIPKSYEVAEEEGLEFTIGKKEIRGAHPNTAQIRLSAEGMEPLEMEAYSIGGGRIRVSKLGDMPVDFSAELNTLVVHNVDQPGCVADVTNVLGREKINIATMQLFRDKRGGLAVMIVETDQVIPLQALDSLRDMAGIRKVTFLNVSDMES